MCIAKDIFCNEECIAILARTIQFIPATCCQKSRRSSLRSALRNDIREEILLNYSSTLAVSFSFFSYSWAIKVTRARLIVRSYIRMKYDVRMSLVICLMSFHILYKGEKKTVPRPDHFVNGRPHVPATFAPGARVAIAFRSDKNVAR